MKPAYDSLNLLNGSHNGGICSIQVAPNNWVETFPDVDFNFGKIITPVIFIEGKDWLDIVFIPKSYDYEEVTKDSAAGTFYEIKISGIVNYSDAALQQIIHTLQYHHFILKIRDLNGNYKLVGNILPNSIILEISYKNTNANNGQQYYNFSFSFTTEELPPYYTV